MKDRDETSANTLGAAALALVVLYLSGLGTVWADVELLDRALLRQVGGSGTRALDLLYGWAVQVYEPFGCRVF